MICLSPPTCSLHYCAWAQQHMDHGMEVSWGLLINIYRMQLILCQFSHPPPRLDSERRIANEQSRDGITGVGQHWKETRMASHPLWSDLDDSLLSHNISELSPLSSPRPLIHDQPKQVTWLLCLHIWELSGPENMNAYNDSNQHKAEHFTVCFSG